MRVVVKGVLSWLVTLVLIGVIFSGQSTAEDDCSCPDGCPVEIIIFMEQRGTFQEPGEGSQVVCNVYVNFTVFYVWSANTSTKFLERVKKNLNETAHEWYNNTGPSGEYNNCNKEWEVYTEDNNGNEVVLGINSNKELYLFCLTIEDTTVTVGAASVYKGNLDQYNPPCEANEFDIKRWFKDLYLHCYNNRYCDCSRTTHNTHGYDRCTKCTRIHIQEKRIQTLKNHISSLILE